MESNLLITIKRKDNLGVDAKEEVEKEILKAKLIYFINIINNLKIFLICV